MKLEQVIVTSKKNAKAAPTVSINFFNGRIAFNAATCEMLGLKRGDAVAFYRDSDAEGHPWYIARESTPGALVLRLAMGATIYGIDAILARKVLDSFDLCVTRQFTLSGEVDGKYRRILNE